METTDTKQHLDSLKLERFLLASLFMEPDKIVDVIDKLKPNMFTFEPNGIIYDVMTQMYANKLHVDENTVWCRIKESNLDSKLLTEDDVRKIADGYGCIVSGHGARAYADAIQSNYIQRLATEKVTGILELLQSKKLDAKTIADKLSKAAIDVTDASDKEGKFSKPDIDVDEIEEILRKKVETKDQYTVGLPTGIQSVDFVMDGLQKGRLYGLLAESGCGKEQPLYSKILTPTGWTTMGEISIGDKIIGSDGNHHNVVGVYPQGVKDVYRVYFKDGDYADCGLEHLWYTESSLDRCKRRSGSVKTTKEIMETMYYECKNKKALNHAIPFVKPINFDNNVELKLDPYVLGVIIGDGHISDAIVIHNVEKDIMNKVNILLSEDEEINFLNRDNKVIGCLIRNKKRSNKPTNTKQAIIEYGLLGKRSYEKFIPKDYLFSTVENRVSLLQGLIDTDGYLNSNDGKFFEYSTMSEQLKDDVIFLVKSLGGRATWSSRMGSYTKNGQKIQTRINYRIRIIFYNGIIPCSSEKNLSKYSDLGFRRQRIIEKIEHVGKHECKCIMVDSPDSLYVTDNFILTHNTTLSLQIGQHISDTLNKKVLLMSFEMANQELSLKLCGNDNKISHSALSKTYKYITDMINEGRFSTYEEGIQYIKNKLIAGKRKLEKSNIKVFEHPNPDVRVIESAVRKFVLQEGELDLLILDHLDLCHNHQNQVNDLYVLTKKLKDIAKLYDIPVLALHQFNRELKQNNDYYPSMHNSRGGAGLINNADCIMLIYRPEIYSSLIEEKPELQGVCKIIWDKMRGSPKPMPVDVDFRNGVFKDKILSTAEYYEELYSDENLS